MTRARRLSIGRLLLEWQHYRDRSFKQTCRMLVARHRHLRQILKAAPINVSAGPLEIHMLLQHKRIFEGLWALYSFLYFFKRPCEIVVHDDGTLSEEDRSHLRRLFPGCRIIDRGVADEAVLGALERKGLRRCAKLRKELIFALKLFDPIFFTTKRYFMLLDSDVLFFREPEALMRDLPGEGLPPNLYLYDPAMKAYLLPDETLEKLLGKGAVPHFNPGLLRVHRDVLSMERIERHLENKEFWTRNGLPHYFSELTLWAMELSLSGAQPLGKDYGFVYALAREQAVCLHYCGGPFHHTFFYTDGLAYLSKRILSQESTRA